MTGNSASTRIELDECPSCSGDGGWVWAPGHVDKRKFKGQLLSRGALPLSGETIDAAAVARARVVHGYVHYVERGYDEFCDADDVLYFRPDTKPMPDKPRARFIQPATWLDIEECYL